MTEWQDEDEVITNFKTLKQAQAEEYNRGKQEVIVFIKNQMKLFAEDMEHAEADGNSDYAYAEGAYNAYEALLKKLEEN